MTAATSQAPSASYSGNPWHALWAMMVGFFMIMLDLTIVAIANPTIMAQLRIGYATVVWVTSAYLLGYAVVLLVAGRLGDRFGPKNLYLIGLVVFTLASVWCGLSGSAAMLITARVVQGVGAGLLTPQTLSTITRIFPASRRGGAMSVWGATAGVASLLGPLVGGVLVDALGWQWIFFVNVPVGVVGLVLAVRLVPELPTQAHRFDLIGVGLSGVGIFAIVFGLQQGQSADWAPWIWAVIVAGVGLMAAFVYWQSVNTREPLIPLRMFSDRDFSLCNVGVALTAFATTAMFLPLTFYTQEVCGLSPTRSALLIAPMAITSGALAPVAGIVVDKFPPQPVLGFGFSMLAIGLTWLSIEMAPATPIWRLVLPFMVTGVGMAFVWSPLAATATRNLPPDLSGASSGVYNATRQLGAVLGSAGMAAFMTWRITAEMPPAPRGAHPLTEAAGRDGSGLQLAEFVRDPFSAAMSQSMLLPAFIALFGIIAALFLLGFAMSVVTREAVPEPDADAFDDWHDWHDWYDDDDYVEYVIRHEPDIKWDAESEGDTQPLPARVRQPRPAPALDERRPQAGPMGLAHNGFHVGGGQFFRLNRPDDRLAPPSPPMRRTDSKGPVASHDSARRRLTEHQPLPNRRHGADPDDPGTYGRHAARSD